MKFSFVWKGNKLRFYNGLFVDSHCSLALKCRIKTRKPTKFWDSFYFKDVLSKISQSGKVTFILNEIKILDNYYDIWDRNMRTSYKKWVLATDVFFCEALTQILVLNLSLTEKMHFIYLESSEYSRFFHNSISIFFLICMHFIYASLGCQFCSQSGNYCLTQLR